MNAVLAAWNEAEASAAMEVMLACCAAQRWAEAMIALRPYSGVEGLSLTADEVWSTMEEPDWMEAFAAHPRIGERKTSAGSDTSAAWSQEEQSSTVIAAEQVLADLAEANRAYEERFGFTYIVCATGKNADEMLAILRRRLANDRETELREAAEQQRQIMQLRLGKWLVQ
jgi:OHCU decarboxylase